MIGRKVATYSRRKPFVNVKETKDHEEDAAAIDSTLPTESFVREDCMLARISSSIRNMDIRLSTPAKSRKSDIRPRLSMAPSAQEMDDLLTCCNQVDGGTPFNSWLETIRWYNRIQHYYGLTFLASIQIARNLVSLPFPKCSNFSIKRNVLP